MDIGGDVGVGRGAPWRTQHRSRGTTVRHGASFSRETERSSTERTSSSGAVRRKGSDASSRAHVLKRAEAESRGSFVECLIADRTNRSAVVLRASGRPALSRARQTSGSPRRESTKSASRSRRQLLPSISARAKSLGRTPVVSRRRQFPVCRGFGRRRHRARSIDAGDHEVRLDRVGAHLDGQAVQPRPCARDDTPLAPRCAMTKSGAVLREREAERRQREVPTAGSTSRRELTPNTAYDVRWRGAWFELNLHSRNADHPAFRDRVWIRMAAEVSLRPDRRCRRPPIARRCRPRRSRCDVARLNFFYGAKRALDDISHRAFAAERSSRRSSARRAAARARSCGRSTA